MSQGTNLDTVFSVIISIWHVHYILPLSILTLDLVEFRDDIKSSGKFAIFTRLKIKGGRGSKAHYGKSTTKNPNC